MDLKNGLIKYLETRRDRFFALAGDIHRHPELSGEEYRSSRLLADELESGGFAVERGLEGLPTAFIAERRGSTKGKGPTIALLAEYDALPEFGHACGHNLIGTAGVYAGLALASISEHWSGRLLVIGTPAEETSGAKIEMLSRGIFDPVDFTMMFHPASVTCVNVHSFANMPLEVSFYGRAAHAAASPQRGINALDALLSLFVDLNLARKHLPDQVRVPGIITEGGVRPNLVPERAVGRFSLRAEDSAKLEEVIRVFRRCARAAAAAHGARVKIRQYEASYREMRTNRPMAEAFAANLKRLGVAVDVDDNERRGSIDMGSVSHKVPAIHPTIKLGDGGASSHSREFARLAGSRTGFETAIKAAGALAMTALDLFTGAGLRAEARAHFREAGGRTG